MQCTVCESYHGYMVEVVDEEDGPQLLCLEGARQLHEQIHAGVPHPVQVVVKLPILNNSNNNVIVIDLVNADDGSQLLGLEGSWQLHEQVHACIPHPVQTVIKLSILRDI